MLRMWIVFVLSIGTLSNAATITGTVVDDKGKAVPDAQVNVADPMRTRVGITQYATTDKGGKFEIGSVSPGTYRVYARLPTSGYGDPEFAFFAAEYPLAPTVKVTSDTTTLDVTVNVGRPGGIMSVTVVSAEGGEPVASNYIRYKLAFQSNPDLFISSNADGHGHFTTPVPAAPISITITCEGYEPATVRDIMSATGERKSVVIKIRKIPVKR